MTGGARRDADQLTAAAIAPVDGLRGLKAAQAAIAGGNGIQEQADFPNAVKDACHGVLRVGGQYTALLLEQTSSVLLDGKVHMQPIAIFVAQGLGHEGGAQPVLRGNGAHGALEGHGVVRGGQRAGIVEVNFILSGAVFVMGAFGLNVHFLQCQADFPADVFPLVQGRHIHIARLILGLERHLAVFVRLKEIEFIFRAQPEEIAQAAGLLHLAAQDGAAVSVKGLSLGGQAVAHHAGHTAGLRPPGQKRQRVRVRLEKQLAAVHIAKALDRRRVKGYPPVKGTGQLGGHDGNVLHRAEKVHKGQTDELDVILLHKLDHFLLGHHRLLLSWSHTGACRGCACWAPAP